MGTRDLRTLWSPLVSLNRVVLTSSSSWISYFPHWNSCEGLFERDTHTHKERHPHTELEDTRKMKFPQLFYHQETHTQRCKVANFIYYYFFCGKNMPKSPPWKYTWWSERFGKFPKKKLNHDISRREKKSFEIVTFWRGKKQVLKSSRFVEDLGRFQAFSFWNVFMKGVLTLTPLPPRRTTKRTDT